MGGSLAAIKRSAMGPKAKRAKGAAAASPEEEDLDEYDEDDDFIAPDDEPTVGERMKRDGHH